MSFISRLHLSPCLRIGAEQGWLPSVTCLRYRYHKDKIARGPLLRLGYNDKVLTHGLYPRDKEFKKISWLKEHKPPNYWSEDKALYGRNDYIDILGDGNLRPTDVCYNVPFWLRGFKGNEYQMLLRREKIFRQQNKEHSPNAYSDMMRRIRYLYDFLNRKKRDYYSKKP